jgi:hypothetical protein
MVVKKLARKQHIVPQSFLSNFTDEKGFLWIYEKDRPIRRGRPEVECLERDFYDYELRGKATGNKYEKWLSQIEGDAAAQFQRLIDRQKLAPYQARIVATFVASLFARTRKVRNQISASMINKFRQQTDDPEFIRNLQYELLQNGELCYAADLEKDVGDLRHAMESEPSFYHTVGLPRHTAVIAEAILRKNWHTVEAPSGSAFVTSDCPVLTFEVVDQQVRPGVGFGKPEAVIFLSLTPSHVFVASNLSWAPAGDAKFVNCVNRLTVQFAHRNVYSNSSSGALRALVDDEINQLVFGQNAFVASN